MHITIMKIKDHKKKKTNLSFKLYIYIWKYNYMNKIFSKIYIKFYSKVTVRVIGPVI